MKIKINKIEQFLGLSTLLFADNADECNIVTDSRNIKEGDIFIAINGENFDAHSYITEIVVNKTSLIIANKSWENKFSFNTSKFIFVEDTIISMLKLSSALLKNLNVSVIAITGTNGKTTTRISIAAAIEQLDNIDQTYGNFNNRIGMPISIFSMKPKTNKLVLEMGTNHFGEIEELSSYAIPNIAIITNIGDGHLEFLKNREGVFKAKKEIISNMTKDSIVIVNGDDEILSRWEIPNKLKKITYGLSNKNDFFITNIEYSIYNTKFVFNGIKCQINMPGKAGAYAGLAAMTVAEISNCDLKKSAKALSNLEFNNGRLQTSKCSGVVIVNDTYNANPSSTEASAELLSLIKTNSPSFLIVGEMGELGKDSKKMHYELGKFIASKENIILFTLGTMASNIAKGAINFGMNKNNVFSFLEESELLKSLKGKIQNTEVALFKASRFVGMENLVNNLIQEIEEK